MYKVEIISIFVENKPGKLEKITKLLAEAQINILGFSITDARDFGIIKFLVDKPQEAYELFKNHGFVVALNPALGIEMKDQPGGLYEVVKFISSKGINIENALVYVAESREKAYFIFEVEDFEEALKKLKDNGFNLLKLV
ncbi:ACT domain-containing protein [Thermodesulfobacterium sp. TA1]|uniref:ACT domain-containing protein n=1 Tax=Thermodesulfobacterium sp. TA1 TaxID=2234087 RepID=UPI001231BB10|nr:ACT domain-containing protein [Thermodesulfobacterium sp. TA1]QER42672.1 ACT domain-containing protein [Thermodesulfobacterium sp. TA1]